MARAPRKPTVRKPSESMKAALRRMLPYGGCAPRYLNKDQTWEALCSRGLVIQGAVFQPILGVHNACYQITIDGLEVINRPWSDVVSYARVQADFRNMLYKTEEELE